MATTVPASVALPKDQLAEIRERYPVLRDLPNGRVIRFALALAIGKTPEEAITYTCDARLIGRVREPA